VARIFISHSSKNNAEALALRDWLVGQGWNDLFLDIHPTDGLVAAERWQSALRASMGRCRAVIFCLSPEWRSSEHCISEFNEAMHVGAAPVGVVIKPIARDRIPGEMTSNWQIVDLTRGGTSISFTVAPPPSRKPVEITFPAEELARLRAGLAKLGLVGFDTRSFPWPPSNEPDRAPYRGLLPLEAADAGVFFGRDNDLVRVREDLITLRAKGGRQLFVILSASGAGKSSFLRAGVLPRLEREDRDFLVLPVIRPRTAAVTGVDGLAQCISTAFDRLNAARPLGDIKTDLQHSIGALPLLLTQLQHISAPTILGEGASQVDRPTTFVLAIDQAEELFSTDGTTEATAFLEHLAAGLQRGPEMIAIATIRSDRYEPLQSAAKALNLPVVQLFDLGPITPFAFREAISGPAGRLEPPIEIEPELIDRLTSDMASQGADPLPLLAFTLERLYRNYGRAVRKLTTDNYEALGGVKGSIDAALQEAFAKPEQYPAILADPKAREAVLEAVFIPALVDINEANNEPLRRIALESELPESGQGLVHRLVEARLLVRGARKNPDGVNQTTIEVAHEALLRQWDALRLPLSRKAEDIKALQGVERAALAWEKTGRSSDWLDHKGERLDVAGSLLKRPEFSRRLSGSPSEYIQSCRQSDKTLNGRRLVQVIIRALGPLLIGAVAGMILAFVAQFHEIYRSLILNNQVLEGLLGFASVLLLSAALYAASVAIPGKQIDETPLNHANPGLGKLALLRHVLGLISASLPLLGLTTGMFLIFPQAKELEQKLETLESSLSGMSQDIANLSAKMDSLQWRSGLIAVLLAIGSVGFMRLLHQLRDGSVSKSWLLPATDAVAVVFLATVLLLPVGSPIAVVALSQLAGPLAVTGLVLLAGTALLRLLVLLTVWARLILVGPLTTFFFAMATLSRTARTRAAGIFLFFGFLLAGYLAWKNIDAQVSGFKQQDSGREVAQSRTELSANFRSWLESRKDFKSWKQYPVFIVAAQGGGIYAASAAATFLSRMQDLCPGFAQHVFAISAVSGGAVGAAIFNALIADAKQQEGPGCLDRPSGALTKQSADIILGDHFSPVLATWLTDFVTGIVQTPLAPARHGNLPGSRDVVLEQSLRRSFEKFASLAAPLPECGSPAQQRGRGLAGSYDQHWCMAAAAPALLLNATWAENGYRVAFSPFSLRAAGDGTLYAFKDLVAKYKCPALAVSIAQAAVVSARFPAILPSWQLDCPGSGRSALKGTFVDGGYADNSGATTALELFTKLKEISAEPSVILELPKETRVDLHLILLTDAPTAPEDQDNRGTWFGDLVAPVETLLNVRELLARRAVTQAVNQRGPDAEDRVMVMQLDQQTFPLTLGWKISETTNDLIKLLLGTPEAAHEGCKRPQPAEGDQVQNDTSTIIKNNSDQMCRIKQLLSPPQ